MNGLTFIDPVCGQKFIENIYYLTFNLSNRIHSLEIAALRSQTNGEL
jgi:hypothetical protein